MKFSSLKLENFYDIENKRKAEGIIMETFADYILGEKDYIKKLEIVYYLQKREHIFFDNSVVLKTELAKLFIEQMNIDVDKNLVITACLLYACKKNHPLFRY